MLPLDTMNGRLDCTGSAATTVLTEELFHLEHGVAVNFGVPSSMTPTRVGVLSCLLRLIHDN